MTELETLIHAKNYIDKMANGINPLSDGPVADGDLINNVRISRCLFYVSGILDKVIQNDGRITKNKSGVNTFSISREALSAYPLDGTSRNISSITQIINDLAQPDVKKLKAITITQWLVELELLEVITYSDKKRKTPTAKGREMGIFTVKRNTPYGDFDAVFYDDNAQRFILDNMEAIASKN